MLTSEMYLMTSEMYTVFYLQGQKQPHHNASQSAQNYLCT